MTAPDPAVAHIVTAAHQIPFSGTWVGFCTCGQEFLGTSADEVREAGQVCRAAERKRLSRADPEDLETQDGRASLGAPGRGVPVSPKSAEAPRTA